ncbi:MAG: IS481 family transposase [Acidimicrobiales bacterium]
MSKRQSVILSVVLEGLSQADAARLYGVSEATVSRWVARYRTDGEAAFEPRSTRPRTSPARLADVVITQIVNLRDELTTGGLDAGPATIAWHLKQRHQTRVSVATIRRHLIAAGRITPEPRKRPRSSFIRFEADLPNETWQTDMTHTSLADGSDAEVLSWLDDHSRYALRVTAHNRVNTGIVVAQFDKTTGQHGLPASVLSDNGLYYTARFARGGASGPNRFEQHLITLGVEQKHSRPNHPTTCGKVERFQQTMKNWLTARPRAANLAALQTLLDNFVDIYNHHRPHRSIGTTPAKAYTRLPKATPSATNADLRVRHDRVAKTGSVTLRYQTRLHHIGIGRGHAGTNITLLIIDRDIRIIATDTGELIRQLTLDPTRDYQPQNTRNPNH